MTNLKENKIRILIDAHLFDDGYQGTRSYLKELYNSLIRSSFPFEFYFVAHNTVSLKKEFPADNDNVFFIPLKSRNKYWRLAVELSSICKKYKIDYAHYQYISPLIKTSKEIVTTHDILFLDYPSFFPKSYTFQNRFLFKRSAKRADLLFTVSEYSKDAIRKHFGIESSDIYISPNAIAPFFFDESQQYPEITTKYNLGKFILYVSRFEPRKNHISLLKAYHELSLADKGYKLVFIGREDIPSEEYRLYLEQLPDKERENIVILHNVDNQELVSFYRTCSLFVFPSLAEGFGIPPLEAIASGVSTICSNATAMKDFSFLGDRQFDPNNLEELKDKINRYLDFKEDSISLKHYVEKNYSWDSVASYFGQIILNHHK